MERRDNDKRKTSKYTNDRDKEGARTMKSEDLNNHAGNVVMLIWGKVQGLVSTALCNLTRFRLSIMLKITLPRRFSTLVVDVIDLPKVRWLAKLFLFTNRSCQRWGWGTYRPCNCHCHWHAYFSRGPEKKHEGATSFSMVCVYCVSYTSGNPSATNLG